MTVMTCSVSPLTKAVFDGAMKARQWPQGPPLSCPGCQSLGREIAPARSQDALPAVYTVEEVATILRVDDKLIRKMIKAKQIRAIQVGRNIRVARAWIENWLAGADDTPDIREGAVATMPSRSRAGGLGQ